MKKRFTITYDIVKEASSQHGDFAYNGYLTRNQTTPRKCNAIPKKPARWTLREAYDFLTGQDTEGPPCPDSCPWNAANPPRWITFSGGLDEYGESTSFSIYPAERDGITGASMVRLARLFNSYGERK